MHLCLRKRKYGSSSSNLHPDILHWKTDPVNFLVTPTSNLYVLFIISKYMALLNHKAPNDFVWGWCHFRNGNVAAPLNPASIKTRIETITWIMVCVTLELAGVTCQMTNPSEQGLKPLHELWFVQHWSYVKWQIHHNKDWNHCMNYGLCNIGHMSNDKSIRTRIVAFPWKEILRLCFGQAAAYACLNQAVIQLLCAFHASMGSQRILCIPDGQTVHKFKTCATAQAKSKPSPLIETNIPGRYSLVNICRIILKLCTACRNALPSHLFSHCECHI